LASLYQAFVDVIPNTRGLSSALSREFSAAGPGAGAAAGRGVNSGVLGAVGKLAGPLAAAFAGIGIGNIIKDSIGNASDLAEAGTAITAVFGSADATIQKFAAGSAASLGQSTNQTLDAARVFGVFGKAAGLGGEDLAGFSTDFITLAGDLASFNNTSPEEAINALGAGLRGESEPLRQYGVLLDDAALKARATTLGIYSGSGALTQQQKVLAAQAEIMAQTGVQQGDFAKTSGGLANQQRILSAGLTNLSTTFGGLLLPAMTAVVGFLNRSVIPALGNIIPAIGGIRDILIGGNFTTAFKDAFHVQEDSALVDFLFTIRESLMSVGDFIKTSIAPAFATLAPVFRDLIPQLLTLWQAFSPLSMIFKAIGPMLPQLVDAFVGLAVTIGGALGAALTELMPAITSLSTSLISLLGAGIFGVVLPALLQLVGVLGPVLGAALTAAVPLFTAMAGIVGQLVAAVIPLIGPIMSVVQAIIPLVGILLPPLIQLFVAILTPVIGLASALITLLVPVLQFVITVLAAVVTWVANALTWFINLVTGSGDAGAQLAAIWNQTMGMFADFFSNTFGMFVDFGANTAGMIGDFVSNTMGMFSDFWSNTVGMFRDGVGNAVKFISGLPGKILDALSGLGGLLVDLGANMIQGLIDGAGGLLKNLGSFFLDIVPAFIREPFKAALGIHSPSKVFAGFGENITDGLIIGVGRGKSAIDSTMTSLVSVPSLTSRVDASVYGSQARATQAPTGGGNVYIDKIVAPDQDPRVAGRVMGREFAKQIAG